LNFDNSFVYNQEVWRASIIGAQTIGGLDLATVVDKFLKAPPNLNGHVPNGTNQATVIVSNMIVYMSKYNDWANNGFQPAGTPFKNAVMSAQGAMMTSVRSIFEPGGGNSDYTPVNGSPCVSP